MLSSLIITSAIGFNGLGYYSMKKGKALGDLFIKIEKIKAFNYNYVVDMKEILNRGTISMAANLPPAEIKNFKTFMHVDKEDQENNYTRHDGQFKFLIHSEKNGYIEILNEKQKTRIFNITKKDKIEKQQIQNLNLNPIQKFQNIFGLLKLYNFDLSKEGQQYVLIGEVTHKQNVKENEPQYEMKVEAILGENKDYFLKFLDEYIMELRHKQFLYYGIGTALLIAHLLFIKLKIQTSKVQEMQQELEK